MGIDITWYWRRLRMMSVREVLAMRLCRTLRDRFAPPSLTAPRGVSLAIEPIDRGTAEQFAERFPHAAERVTESAEMVLQNTLRLFDREYALGEPIDWERDYRTGKRWPSLPVGRLNYRDTAAGDPKDVWELNRHQFLPVLGQAYLLTGREEFARKAVDLILSWIVQCPPLQGINWTSGIELAIRQISWLWTLRCIAGCEVLSDDARSRIRDSLYAQTRHIAGHLSLYSSANNHLIAELAALAVVGQHLGQSSWMETATRLLNEQIGVQIYADGVGAEQSTAYQAHTMEFYGLAMLALTAGGYEVAASVSARLAKGGQFLAALLDGDGALPCIGDSDSGHVLTLTDRYDGCRSLLNLTAHLTHDDTLIQRDVAADEKTFWLIGSDAFDRQVARTPSSPPERALAYPQGGYYILDGDLAGHRVRALFDCGPVGLSPMAGHGHADALSVLLYVDGVAVLIDPGTFTYFRDKRLRNYFRGTSAHSTVRIDGRDQTVYGGAFIAVQQARSECLDSRKGKCVTGRSLGYTRLADPVTHTRTLAFMPEQRALQIEDRIKCAGEHELEQFFHFEKRLSPQLADRRRCLAQLTTGEMVFQLDERVMPRLVRGDDTLPLGWTSSVYGAKEPTTTLVATTTVHGDATLLTKVFF